MGIMGSQGVCPKIINFHIIQQYKSCEESLDISICEKKLKKITRDYRLGGEDVQRLHCFTNCVSTGRICYVPLIYILQGALINEHVSHCFIRVMSLLYMGTVITIGNDICVSHCICSQTRLKQPLVASTKHGYFQ